MVSWSYAATNLKLVRGYVVHDPEQGLPPPLKTDLIDKAREKALANLGDAEKYQQLSAWHDEIKCTPVYKGSLHCYSADIRSEASFVPVDRLEDTWLIAASGLSDSWLNNSRDISYQQALQAANFWCNGKVLLPPIQEEWNLIGCWKGLSRFLKYNATFECIK